MVQKEEAGNPEEGKGPVAEKVCIIGPSFQKYPPLLVLWWWHSKAGREIKSGFRIFTPPPQLLTAESFSRAGTGYFSPLMSPEPGIILGISVYLVSGWLAGWLAFYSSSQRWCQ